MANKANKHRTRPLITVTLSPITIAKVKAIVAWELENLPGTPTSMGLVIDHAVRQLSDPPAPPVLPKRKR